VKYVHPQNNKTVDKENK